MAGEQVVGGVGVRPLPVEAVRRMARIGGLLYVTCGLSATLAGIGAGFAIEQRSAYLAMGGFVILVGLTTIGLASVATDDFVARVFAPLALGLIFAAPALTSLGLQFAGLARWAAGSGVYLLAPIFAFSVLRRWWAVALVGTIAVEYAAVLAASEGISAPVSQWVFLVAVVVATAILVGGLVERSDRLAEAERRARIDLAAANALLETRVADQVDQLARLDRLRRFLSTDVAEAVMSAGPGELLQPHRRAIAVLFCDLRGFTRFTSDAEPEEVVELLEEYYDVVAEVLARHRASVGSFAGDGVLAYVGDPVRVADPVGIALDAARALRAPLERLLSRWADRGFELGHGVGIAYGFATLGMIGTVDRCDYTPLGSVVNLAARLCTEAKDGEIILDGRARGALAGRVRTEGATYVLKGFGEVEAHRVLGFASEATVVPLRAALA